MLTKIWQRHIFFELVKCFVFFLVGFFLLYFLADFSTHIQDFIKNNQFYVNKAVAYYTHQFFKRLPLLLPLALLISTIKVLISLNVHRELVALQTSGLRLRKILSPFWLLACLCCIVGYINEEVVIPKIAVFLDEAKQARSKNPLKRVKKKPFVVLHLKDSSKLIYQTYDPQNNSFIDVFWIRSFDDIWHMKTLSSDPKKKLGSYVDHLVRNSNGFLEKKESYTQCTLPALDWRLKDLTDKQSSVKHAKLSNLASNVLKKRYESFHSQGEATTYFFYRLMMPLTPFLILMGVTPFCVVYSRKLSPPLIYGIAIFCFVVFFTLMDSLIIIGKNQTVSPQSAIGIPFLFVLIVCYGKFRSILAK